MQEGSSCALVAAQKGNLEIVHHLSGLHREMEQASPTSTETQMSTTIVPDSCVTGTYADTVNSMKCRMAKLDDSGACPAMHKMGLMLKREDRNNTLEFDETNQLYWCMNTGGKSVECLSVTDLLTQHMFQAKLDIDAVLNRY